MSKIVNFRIFAVIIFLLAFNIQLSWAQGRHNQAVQVLVSTNKTDWNYQPGEKIKFYVTVLKNHQPVKDITANYTIGFEKMKPHQKGSLKLSAANVEVGKASSSETPGFIRCEVSIQYEGIEYKGLATAAIAADQIQPTQIMPSDFNSFWDNELNRASKIPLDVKYTLLPEKCTPNVNVYHIRYRNIDNSYIYGILAKPKKEGKYPGLLSVPGAGIRPYNGLIEQAEQGFITLQIGIHGIPVIYETELYNNLATGALKNYQFNNLDNKDTYYYKRVYIGASRGIDVLSSLEEVDNSKLIVWGQSQGGALAIVTSVLNKKVNGLVSVYPALSDMTGYLHNRAGGWPHMFNETNGKIMATKEKIQTTSYYDVVNFAKQITVPGFYTWGYNDETCPPTTFYAAYNQINASKELYLVQETGHWTYPEQQQKVFSWIKKSTSK